MAGILRLVQGIKRWITSISIFYRIVIANAFVITLATVLGVLIAQYNPQNDARNLVIGLLVLAVVLIGIGLDLFIVRTALKPFQELRKFVAASRTSSKTVQEISLSNPDPDTRLLALTLCELFEQLETNNRQLRAITQRAINAQEDERKRIARWLHDDTGQALLSLNMNLQRLENKVNGDDKVVKEKLSEAILLTSKTLEGLRKIIYGLRPSILDDLGLAPAIRWYARTNLEAAGIQVTVDVPDDPLPVPLELKTSLFRIAQEAINNIVLHSQANNAAVKLGRTNHEIFLCIEDDGRGFSVATDQDEAIRLQQWGLLGIHERIELIGGNYSLTSAAGKGTLLQVYVPFNLPVEVEHGQNQNSTGR